LVARTHTAVDARSRCARALCSPRGTNAPLLCWRANVCRRKNDFCDAQTHAHKERRASLRRGSGDARAAENEFVAHDERQDQERRALARRGSGNAPAAESEFVAHNERRDQERRALARRGFGNVTATAFAYGRSAGRPCATIAVLPLPARFRNHGWLTPAAPGCTVFDRRGNDDFCDMRTHLHESGGR
jgi:hypothetical protein